MADLVIFVGMSLEDIMGGALVPQATVFDLLGGPGLSSRGEGTGLFDGA
jgi:hypothetical protein